METKNVKFVVEGSYNDEDEEDETECYFLIDKTIYDNIEDYIFVGYIGKDVAFVTTPVRKNERNYLVFNVSYADCGRSWDSVQWYVKLCEEPATSVTDNRWLDLQSSLSGIDWLPDEVEPDRIVAINIKDKKDIAITDTLQI